MKTPHKHASLIKKWADGEIIQYWRDPYGWEDCDVSSGPAWCKDAQYRVKPVVKPDIVVLEYIEHNGGLWIDRMKRSNVKFIFDGDTKMLKSVEMLDD